MEVVRNKIKLHLILEKVVKNYIVYDISKSINISNYLTLENCLFGAVSLANNAVIETEIWIFWIWNGI